MMNKLIDIIVEVDIKLKFSQKTIIREIKKFHSIINLIFMFNKFINKKTIAKQNEKFIDHSISFRC